MELRKLLEIIWRRKWILIHAPVVFVLTALVISYYMPSVYETSAHMLVQDSEATAYLKAAIGLTDSKSTSISQDQFEADIATYIELATSKTVVETVIERLQLRSTKGKLYETKDLLESVPFVSSLFPKPNVKVEQEEDSSRLLTIEAEATDPDTAAILANVLAKTFIEELHTQIRDDFTTAGTFLEMEIDSVKEKYAKALENISQFKTENNVLDLEQDLIAAIERMSELLLDKEGVIREINELKSKIITKKIFLEKLSIASITDSAISLNPQIEELLRNITALNQSLAEALSEQRETHPNVRALKLQIESAQASLGREIEIMRHSSSELEELELQLRSREEGLQTINASIAGSKLQNISLPAKESILSRLETQLLRAESQYSVLLDTLYDIGLAKTMPLSKVKFIEKAPVPDAANPASPSKALNCVLGLILGAMFGGFLTLLVEYLDDSIRTAEDVKKTGIDVLGEVPNFTWKHSPLLAVRRPGDTVSQCFRLIRTIIRLSDSEHQIKSLLITGASKEKGSSVCALNLGASYASEGKRVLLVDGNFRNPSLHKLVGKENRTGITTSMADDHDLADAIVPTGFQGLSFLASGPVQPDPGLILESEKMSSLLAEGARQYDMIIIHTSCLGGEHDDAISLAQHTDRFLIIIDAGKTTERQLKQINNRLKLVDMSPIGTILNRWKK